MTLLRTAALLVTLLMVGSASSQSLVVGVTYDALRSVGSGAGLAFGVPLLEQTLDGREAWVGLRGDLFVPLGFDLWPSSTLSLSVWLPDERWVAFGGLGLGLWFNRVEGVACWDLTAVVHAGVDWGLTGDLSVRGEVQSAPLLGETVLRFGLSYAFGAQ